MFIAETKWVEYIIRDEKNPENISWKENTPEEAIESYKLYKKIENNMNENMQKELEDFYLSPEGEESAKEMEYTVFKSLVKRILKTDINYFQKCSDKDFETWLKDHNADYFIEKGYKQLCNSDSKIHNTLNITKANISTIVEIK